MDRERTSPTIAREKTAQIWTDDVLPEEVSLELGKGNLVRAAKVAVEKGRSSGKSAGVAIERHSAIHRATAQLRGRQGTRVQTGA